MAELRKVRFLEILPVYFHSLIRMGMNPKFSAKIAQVVIHELRSIQAHLSDHPMILHGFFGGSCGSWWEAEGGRGLLKWSEMDSGLQPFNCHWAILLLFLPHLGER